MREILFRAKIEETEFQNIPSGWGQKDGDWVTGLYYTCNKQRRKENEKEKDS